MIRVKLNDNTFIDVQGTDNNQDAAAAARRWFRENRPEEFEAWRQTQLGLGRSATRGLSAGIDQFQSSLYSAAEGLGRAVGSESLEGFGRAGRIEQQREAEAAFPSELRQPFTEVTTPGGAARATTEAVTGSLPSSAASIAGAVAGSRAGAPLGFRGRVAGGILGGAAAAFPTLFGSNIERQIQESGDITSPGAAAGAAAIQAPLESAADVATLGAARLIRRPATEAAQVAGAGLGRRIATGAGVGALTETPVEVAQTALERAQAGLPVFTTEGGAGREYLEAGLGGLAAGTVTGGAVSGVFGQRPTAARTPEQETAALETMRQGSLPGEGAVPGAPIPPAPAPAPAATSRFAPLTVPERPEAFATAEETEAFLAQNPNFPAPPAAMATPEARTAWVNAARQAAYQREVGILRQSAVSNFAATQPETFLGNLAQAAAEGNLKNLNSFTANDVVNAALRSSSIEPGRLTKEERQFANEQLTNLANAGILAKPTATSFSVSFAPRREAAAPTAERAPTRAEREAAQREVLELSAAAETGTVGQITPFEARRLGAETRPFEQAAPVEGEAIWQGPNADIPVRVLPEAPQQGTDGRLYQRVNYEGRDSYVPADQLRQTQAAPQAGASTPPIAPTLRPRPAQTVPNVAARPPSVTRRPTVGPTPAPVAAAKAPMPDDLKKQIDSQTKEPIIGSVLNFFASPVLSLSKMSPTFFPFRQAVQKFISLESVYKDQAAGAHKSIDSLNNQSKQKVILALRDARRNGQEVNPADFTPEEMAAIRDFRNNMDFTYDAAIEGLTRKYFDPDLATDPAQRARLEAFRNQHLGQFLAKIPNAELEAVSPEGAKAVREYNAQRDPLYFPERSQGTHFVAAYKRKPDGQREADAIALVPYTPLNARQEKRGFADPEAEAIRQLREEFPNTATHYVMPAGQRFENDARARDVKANADFISTYLDELRNASGREGKQIIDRMSKEIDKATMKSLFKPYKGILRAVTPQNAVEYASDYLPAYYLTAARLNARLYTKPDFDTAFKQMRPENRERFQSILDRATSPSEAYGAAQTFVFFQYLGGALDTAAVSGLQIPVSVAPRFARDAGVKGEAYLAKALNDGLFDKAIFSVLSKDQAYSKTMAEKPGRRDETEAVLRAIRRGVFIPTASYRMQGSVSANDMRTAGIADKDALKFANGINKVVDLAGRPLAAVEEYGRHATFLAAYRMARDNPEIIEAANRYDNANYKNAEDYAAGVVFDTWYTASKFDDPGFVRDYEITNLTFQFMRPVFKLTETLIRDAFKTLQGIAQTDMTMARMGAISFFGSIGTLVLLGGLWALPFADLSRELLERMLKTFFDNPVDFRLELDRAMGGGFYGEAANFGLPQASNIANLSKRIAVDPLPADTLFDWSTLALIGPAGDLIARIPKTYDHWKRGEYWEAAVAFPLTPRVVGNAIRGAQLEIEQEQFTQAGTRFITPELLERVDSRLNVPASARQALGFPAPELATERELWRRQQFIDRATDDATKSINMELSRTYLRALEAQQRGDMTEAARQFALVERRRQEFAAEQQSKAPHLRVQPSMSAVRERALQDLRGRSSPDVLMEQTRRQARPALSPVLEEMRWRDRQ